MIASCQIRKSQPACLSAVTNPAEILLRTLRLLNIIAKCPSFWDDGDSSSEVRQPLCPTTRKAAYRLHENSIKALTLHPDLSSDPLQSRKDLSTAQLLRHSAAPTYNVDTSIWQMVITWRRIRPLPLPPRPATTLPPTRLQLRRLSACPTASPNVATVLATPPRHGGHTITVQGSIRTIRSQKQRSFVELGDGSTAFPLQAVLDPRLAKGHVQ